MMYIMISWTNGCGKPEVRGTCVARCAPCTETSDNVKRCTHHSVIALNMHSKCLLLNSAQYSTPFATEWKARGSNSCCGTRFSSPVPTGPGVHAASCTMDRVASPGVKRPGRGVDHPPPSSAEVDGRVELYICSPTGPSWPVLGWTLPLPLLYLTPSVLDTASDEPLAL